MSDNDNKNLPVNDGNVNEYELENNFFSFINPELYQRIQNAISLQKTLISIEENTLEDCYATIESLGYFSSEQRYSIFIRNVSIISIFRPLLIESFAQLIKYSLLKQEASNPSQSLNFHFITLNELFHYMFISDEINFFFSFFHLTFQLYNKQVFTAIEIVDSIRRYFKKYIIYRGAITSAFAMFAPEIEYLDPELFEMMYKYIKTWIFKDAYIRDTNRFYQNFDYYKANDFEKLKEIRRNVSCNFKYFEIFINDDINQLRSLSSNPNFSVDKLIASPFLSPFFFLVGDFPILGCAAAFGAVKCFKYLILNGANFKITKGNPQIPQYAMIGGSIEIIRICEQYEMDFEGTLQSSATFYHNGIVEYLNETRFHNLMEVSTTKAITIVQAVTSNNFELLLNCLEMKCDVNQVDGNNMNCLKKASFFGLSEMVELLLSIPGIELNKGEFQFATQNGHFDTLKIFIETAKKKKLDFNINYNEYSGMPAVFDAAARSHLKCLDLIVRNGGDINFKVKNEVNIFHFIASQNDVRIFEYMKDKLKFDINSEEMKSISPLNLSILHYAVDMIKYLLDNYNNVSSPINFLSSLNLALSKGLIYNIEPFMKFSYYKSYAIKIAENIANPEIKYLNSLK